MSNDRDLMIVAFIASLLCTGVMHAEPAAARPVVPVEIQSAENDREKAGIEVAQTWFAALVGGDADGALAVSAVPFTFDSRHTIETMPELKAAYDEIAADKGVRDIQPTSVQIESSSPEKVVVLIRVEDEGVYVDVQVGDAFRVVGFRD